MYKKDEFQLICDHCEHLGVCMYTDNYKKLNSNIDDILQGAPSIFKSNLNCTKFIEAKLLSRDIQSANDHRKDLFAYNPKDE